MMYFRSCCSVAVLVICLYASTNSFTSPFNKWISHSSSISYGVRSITNVIQRPVQQQLYAKKDLFSDDIFDDDEEESKDKSPAGKETPKKKNYLDENWQLSPTDQKEFKGFPNKDDAPKSYSSTIKAPSELVDTEDSDDDTKDTDEDDDDEVPNYPVFALVYKFRREYAETSTDALVADHKGYSVNFKRLLNTEVLRMSDTKGIVNLWVGFTEEDKAATKEEIMQFVEEDPLITKDVIERWDIIDLSQDGSHADPADLAKLPSVVA